MGRRRPCPGTALKHPLAISFDQAIALEANGHDQWLGRTSPAYANMVGPFGGITAAQALNAVLQHPQLLGEPVSLTVNFAAPLADGPFTARARPARARNPRRFRNLRRRRTIRVGNSDPLCVAPGG